MASGKRATKRARTETDASGDKVQDKSDHKDVSVKAVYDMMFENFTMIAKRWITVFKIKIANIEARRSISVPTSMAREQTEELNKDLKALDKILNQYESLRLYLRDIRDMVAAMFADGTCDSSTVEDKKSESSVYSCITQFMNRLEAEHDGLADEITKSRSEYERAVKIVSETLDDDVIRVESRIITAVDCLYERAERYEIEQITLLPTLIDIYDISYAICLKKISNAAK